MIEFRLISIQNFLSIGAAQIYLDNQGLVLINGENLDDPSAKSNGSGKSSIVDAISWCLYGITAKGVRADSVVNLKAGKDCTVSMLVTVDSKMYRITRFRKHKNGNKVTLEEIKGGIITHHTGGTDKITQARIENLLGCDAETFNASIYMGQESMVDLPALTDKALKQILQSAMGLDRLDHAAMLADAALTNGYNAVTAAERGLANIQDQIKAARVMQSTVEGVVEHSRKTIKAESIILEEEKDSFARKHNDAHDEVNELKSQLTKADLMLAKAYDATTQVAGIYAKPLQQAREILTATQKARDQQFMVERELTGELKALKTAQESGVCHACKRPHDGAVDHTVEIAKLQEQVVKARAHMNHVEDEFKDARAAHFKVEDHIAEKAKIAEAAVTKVKTEIATLKAKLHAAERYVNRLADDWAESLKKKEAFIDRLKMTQRDHVKKALEAFDLVNSLMKDESDKAINVKYLKSKMQPLENAAHALSRKGFRGEVFDQITPYLNSRTAHYLDQLTEGNITATWVTIQEDSRGDYQEKFHIEINHKSGVDQFAMLSGGEKRKVRLATALALQDLVATRAIKPIRLFVADEIDDAIDESGLELLMGVLEQKARDVGTVMIISHNPIADLVRNVITVVKKDNISTVKDAAV